MADDTHLAKKYSSVYQGGSKKTKWCKCGEVFGPSDVIRVVAGVGYLAQTSDGRVSGVVKELDGMSLSESYATTDLKIPYFPKGQDTDVIMKLAPLNPIVGVDDGDLLTTSTVDGQVIKQVYADAAPETDSSVLVIGKALIPDAQHITDMHLIKANLSAN
ncbi:MAG: hypothetical protein KAJ19_28115 [Gammaproteobacteria bacterium]|nr:hypothetical protein [Gammaproteobacteria bacterium]